MTHVGWHAKEFTRFNEREDRPVSTASGADAGVTNPHQPAQHSTYERAEPLRRKIRQAAVRHQRMGQFNSPPAVDPVTEPLAQPVSEKTKKSRQIMFGAVLIPAVGLAMVGLFALGYQGGKMMVGYMDSESSAPAQALINPVELPAAVTEEPVAKLATVMESPPAPVLAQEPAPVAEELAPAAEEVVEIQPTKVVATAPAVIPEPETIPAPEPVPAPIIEASNEPVPVSLPASLVSEADGTAALQVATAPEVAADSAPAVKAEDTTLAHAAKLIGEGHSLLAKGDVLGARDYFNKGLKLGLPEAALALGRSFDPAYLAQLPSSNAEADVNVASSLYRDWYNRSVAAGSIAEGVQLDKLIQSMSRQ